MEKFLKPERLSIEPGAADATQVWMHWRCTFDNFLRAVNAEDDRSKLSILTNLISADVYRFVSECESYASAMLVLESIFVKPKNIVFARHQLAARRQETGETVDQFLQSLRQLAKECQFKAVTASLYRDEYIRDAFIRGLSSNDIRQRLLEKCNLTLSDAEETALSLELAQINCGRLSLQPLSFSAAVPESRDSYRNEDVTSELSEFSNNLTMAKEEAMTAATENSSRNVRQKCFYCGMNKHTRTNCPARDVTCRSCQKIGHYAKVCRSSSTNTSTTASTITLATVKTCAVATDSLSRAVLDAYIGNLKL